jgi:hypothetical protein
MPGTTRCDELNHPTIELFDMNIVTTTATAILAGAISFAAHGSQSEEYLPVKKATFVNLLDLLVQKGVIEKKDARGLVSEAEEDAKSEARRRDLLDSHAASHASKKSSGVNLIMPGQQNGGEKEKDSIHVGYVPEFVKREMRDEIRAELREDILKDVKQTAIQDKWAFSDLLPGWMSRLHPYIDGRLRLSQEFYDKNNAPYFNWLAINNEGGISQALLKDNALFNTTVDNLRLQERFRLGFDADIFDSLKLGMRLTTTNFYNPVSTNQEFGNDQGNWLVALDRAFFQYDFIDNDGNDWFTLWGGRIPNTFMSTEMMFSQMLSFSGLVGTFRYHFNQSDSMVSSYHAQPATSRMGMNLGPQTPDSVFATMGFLPIEDTAFSSHDKYMYAAQAGADWLPFMDSRFKIAASYYGYQNVRAIRNEDDSFTYNYTAPRFLQKGNSLGAINDAKNQTYCNSGALGAQNVCLVGLASGFNIFDVNAVFDYGGFAPAHILLSADYANNFGFDAAYIKNMFGQDIAPQTNAYLVRLDVGRPELRQFSDWNFFVSYRYIERDAVMDAFNDPIFHTGGTDAKGYTLAAQYGLAPNTWVDLRWLSSDSISGPPLAIDTINLDLNAKF